jgi:hypothetical protein
VLRVREIGANFCVELPTGGVVSFLGRYFRSEVRAFTPLKSWIEPCHNGSFGTAYGPAVVTFLDHGGTGRKPKAFFISFSNFSDEPCWRPVTACYQGGFFLVPRALR